MAELMKPVLGIFWVGLFAAAAAQAQSVVCEDEFKFDSRMACYRQSPDLTPLDPFQLRMLKYAALAFQHRLGGLASYYSASLAGTLTANGERYRPQRLT